MTAVSDKCYNWVTSENATGSVRIASRRPLLDEEWGSSSVVIVFCGFHAIFLVVLAHW